MTLRIYNTMAKGKQEFEPISPGKVKMYVCGVTVYDMCHIGHARSQIVFDTIFRYLKHIGFDVTYARNFTDIDDKIIKRSHETGTDWKDVSGKYIGEFYKDMDALGLLRPTVEPKATEHIEDIVGLVSKLVENGVGYDVDGDVYFEVDKFPGYGKLSKRNVKDMLAGARIEVDERKRSPMDFALWKSSKPNEPSWDSPWGPGRPGWHIECSAMSCKHLGETFDIHGGGKDLVFPHHENEIAQSEAANKKPFVRYWMHNGFVNINSEKMSKSLGNFFTIRDVLALYPPEAIRLFMLSSHYRSPIDYSDQALAEAMPGLDRMYAGWEALSEHAPDEKPDVDFATLKDPAVGIAENLGEIEKQFTQAMDDDFNTAKAIGHMFELVRQINSIIDLKKKTIGRDALLYRCKEMFEAFRFILGLPIRPSQEYRKAIKEQKLSSLEISAEEIEAKIAERTQARKNKDFTLSDKIRDELAEQGIVLKDSKEGTTWDIH